MIVVGGEKGRDSDHPVGSRPVFDDNWLSPTLGKPFRKKPRGEI
jgi:hypothetical protein